eukprot:2853986-Rhodomonas_salina.1
MVMESENQRAERAETVALVRMSTRASRTAHMELLRLLLSHDPPTRPFCPKPSPDLDLRACSADEEGEGDGEGDGAGRSTGAY